MGLFFFSGFRIFEVPLSKALDPSLKMFFLDLFQSRHAKPRD